MIQRQTAVRFYVGEQEFNTLREAQNAELLRLLDMAPLADDSLEKENSVTVRILDNAAKVIDILSTTESSLVKARKINGGRKTRKRALPVVPATGNPVTTTDA